MKCGMCGHEFDSSEAETSCGGCPMVKGCHLVRCPRCGYEMPPESMLVNWLRRIRNEDRIGRMRSRMGRIFVKSGKRT